jgi:hypothetical protein
VVTVAWSRNRLLVLVGVVIALEGIASVRIGFAAFEARVALLTLLAGWIAAGCGLVAWTRAPTSRVGPLFVAAAGGWFIGGFR